MPRPAKRAVYSKLTVKSQTVLPLEVRQRLRVAPGDRLRYLIDAKGVRVEKVEAGDGDDPFATFTEWSGEADEEAYADL